MSQESDPVVDRRSVLKLGSTALATALAGCQWGSDDPGPTSETPTPTDRETEDGTPADGSPVPEGSIPYSDRFETVVDVVGDAGADPNGEESIVPLLKEHVGDDTLLYFPQGRYLMDGLWMHERFTNLGIVGDGATIVPRDGYNDYLFVLGLPDAGSSGLLFEGFEFDFTASRNTHPRPIQVQIDDGFVVRNVAARGTSGTARFDATREGGEGLVRNLGLADGGLEPNPVGVLVGPENRGKVTFRDCHIEGFPGNGLYASPSKGPVHVLGGTYANSGIANVRVSGPTVVRDVHVRCNRAPDGFRNMRGIRLRNGRSAVVENCRIEMTDVTYSEGAIVVERLMDSPTIRDVDVELSADGVPAINAKSPTRTRTGNRSEITCENVSIRGTAANGPTVRIVDRDQCVLEGVDVTQSGADRDGIRLVRSQGTNLSDATIDVTGEPIVLKQSNLNRSAVSIE